MAHFAELDENNVVLRVITVENYILLDKDNIEREEIGINYCKKLFGEDTRWVQTSYNHRMRNRYAGEGFTYLQEHDVFITPKPDTFPSWVLNMDTFEWVPPIAKPDNGLWSWDEETQTWVDIDAVHNVEVIFPDEPKPDDIPGYVWTFTEADRKWFKVKLPDREPPTSEGLAENQFWDWSFEKEDWVIVTLIEGGE